MTNLVNLAPFNEILTHCLYCGKLPVVKPFRHLKSLIIAQQPEEGDGKIVYLSDDFRQILLKVLGVDLRLEKDANSPLEERKLYEDYYFSEHSEPLDDSFHTVELSNSLEGAVSFEQKVENNCSRYITFAYSQTEYQEYNQFERIQKEFEELGSKTELGSNF